MSDQTVTEKVLAVWHQNNGWIPGAALEELAEALDMDALRDGRADTGCGFFTHDTDEGKAGMQERYTQRLKARDG